MTRVHPVSDVIVSWPGDAVGSAMMTPTAVTIDAAAAASHKCSRRRGRMVKGCKAILLGSLRRPCPGPWRGTDRSGSLSSGYKRPGNNGTQRQSCLWMSGRGMGNLGLTTTLVCRPKPKPFSRLTRAAGVAGRPGWSEVAVSADHGTEDPRRESAQQILDAGLRAHNPLAGALITWRTSMVCRIGAPSGPGAADAFAAISMARSSLSTSTSQ